jgi:hypothetical protein
LAPLFSLIAALLMRRDLRRMSGSEKPFALRWKGLAAGFLLVFLAIGLAEMTFALTKIGIEKASSDSPEKQSEGLNFIRRYGMKITFCGFVTAAPAWLRPIFCLTLLGKPGFLTTI